ncbi:MAG: inositol monophosphatase family protein [Phycisphaerae bacterium]
MSDDPTISQLHANACELARHGADVAQSFFGSVTTMRKQDDTPVTEADHAAQEAILRELARRFPRHAVLVEEAISEPCPSGIPGTADYCWVIDPIDGTRNFARGIAVYATSVSVLHRGEPVAGAIHDVTTNITYSAAKGAGAYRNEAPLVLVDRPIHTDTTILISSFRRRPIPDAVRGWMDRYLFRNQGSLCLHLAWVAAGLADAAYALECKLWDIAAGALIIEQAGGIITTPSGRPCWPMDLAHYQEGNIPILAGSPTLYAELMSTLVPESSDD